MRTLWIQAQEYALTSAAELEKTASRVLAQAGEDASEGEDGSPKDFLARVGRRKRG